MRILITGSNGFVARYMIDKLKECCEIIGIGRAADSKTENIRYIQSDISDRAKLFAAVEEQIKTADILIHTAAEISNDIEALYRINCYGTQNIVDLSERLHCKRVIYISSVPVIGHPRNIPVKEDHQVEPLSVYHYTKYFGEQIISQLDKKNILYTILRIASPVGAGMPENKIFSAFVKRSMDDAVIEIYGSGERVQNYIDVRDLACAVEHVIASKAQGMFLIPGNSISDKELASCCVRCNNSASEILIKNNDDGCKNEKWIISGEAARKAFFYEPQKTIEDSIKFVAEGIKK